MWRLCNYLLGWDYVMYTDTYNSFIARAIKCPNGKLMMMTGSSTYDAIMKDDGTFENAGGKWSALTW